MSAPGSLIVRRGLTARSRALASLLVFLSVFRVDRSHAETCLIVLLAVLAFRAADVLRDLGCRRGPHSRHSTRTGRLVGRRREDSLEACTRRAGGTTGGRPHA